MTQLNSEKMLGRLIGFDTTSTTSNLELIDFIRNYLDDFSIIAAGNLLDNEGVPAAMIESFENSSGSFGQRILNALKAGVDAGGEAGPLRSSGLLIGGEVSWPLAELRIDWDDDPIGKLIVGWVEYEPQIDDYVTRALDPSQAPAYGVPGDL